MAETLAANFHPLTHYTHNQDQQGYTLLPFRFIRLEGRRYVATNLAGEYHVLSWGELQDLVRKRLDRESPLYNDLKAKHFLMDGDSSVALDLLALKYRTKMATITNFTGLHIFVVTLRCDHSCEYCQVSRQTEDRTAFDMPAETALKAIDFTFQSPNPYIKIEFQGGESLLNFELIQLIVQEAKRRNETEKRHLEFVIASNLSPLTDEMLAFCLEQDIYLSTSLDGPSDLHNLNRFKKGRDSYQRTINGLERARAVLGPHKVSALMTTTVRSLPRVKNIIDEYLQQGFHSIFLRSLSPYGFAIKTKSFDGYQIQEWLDFYFEGLAYILELNKQGVYFVEEYAALLLRKILTPFGTGYVDLQSPAGIGIGAVIFNYDGDVYASDESRMLAEMGDKRFRLGHLHTQTYEDIMLSDALLDTLEQTITESMPGCHDCGFQPYCGSDPVYHYTTQGDIVGNKALSSFCSKNMTILRFLIQSLEDDPTAKQIFQSWIR